MVRLVRRTVSWLVQHSGQSALNAVFQRGSRAAIDSVLGTAVDVVPKTSQRTYTQVFNVNPPITVYVRGSHCRISVRRDPAPRVVLEANLYRAFGIELAAEQDEAGVYIVAKRKAIVGQITRAEFTLTVPVDSHLAFHLTPGEVVFQQIDGLMELTTAHIFPTTTPPNP